MKAHKSLLIGGAVAAIGLSSLIGVGTTLARGGWSDSLSDSLVEKIATTFSLDESAVQAVFDEQQAERQAEHWQEVADRLQEAVDDGNITAEQKTMIEAKLQERETARTRLQDQLQTWADENGIALRYLMGGGRFADDRLDDAVEDGDITADQQTLIEQKREELQDQRQTERDTLQQWADENNITMRYMMGGFEGPGEHGGGPEGSGGPF